jgi:predicted ribonuclease YlaK
MKKVFLLDTNVLLHDPNAMLRFEDNDVALPPNWRATRAITPSWRWPWNYKHHYDLPVVLVSKDTNLRIKADALGWSPKTMKPTKLTLMNSTPAPWR